MATRGWTTLLEEEFSHPTHTPRTPRALERDLGRGNIQTKVSLNSSHAAPRASQAHLEVTRWSLPAVDKDQKRCRRHARSGLQLRSCKYLAPNACELPGNHAHSTAERTEAWNRSRVALDPMPYRQPPCRVGRSKA